MELIHRGNISKGQDGAIWGDLLFRFENRGLCHVYDLGREDFPEVGQFRLNRWETLCPHSNSVSFGTEYWVEGDEFPLLYSNIYNNYSKEQDRKEGVCCVYRIFREGDAFQSTMVQVLKVGFVADETRWGIGDNIRPYGNFVVDREKKLLYAFTMRDGDRITRYFSFPLPKAAEGILEDGLRVCTLMEPISSFDCPYHHFVQGACIHGGKLISLEGFTDSVENPPAIRVIDLEAGKQVEVAFCRDMGTNVEPEFVDYQGDVCWYSDNHGNLYNLTF